MQLFYDEEITAQNKGISFSKEESRHITKVLRKSAGDSLWVTNGLGTLVQVEIIDSNPKSVLANVISRENIPPLPYRLQMAVAPTKLNDRFEWFLEKATEIGITEITPIICEHSERRVIKAERYERIIQSAMKQSLKAWKPILNPALPFEDFIKKSNKYSQRCIAHCFSSERSSLKEIVSAGDSAMILIGPEGDFSEREVELAVSEGFTPVNLGKSRLRTETADVVACHSIAFINQ